jgi:hypothetical protein
MNGFRSLFVLALASVTVGLGLSAPSHAASASGVWTVGSFVPQNDPDEGSHILTESFNGSTWRRVPPEQPANTQSVLGGVAVVSRSDVWGVGNVNIGRGTLIEHFDGSAWSIADSPSIVGSDNSTTLNDAVAIASNDVWAVGINGGGLGIVVEHWNGANWSLVPAPDPTQIQPSLNAIDAVGPNDVWAVGSFGTPGGIIPYKTLSEHWDGQSWKVVASPNKDFSSFLTDVTAVSANDAWAVGFRENIDTIVTGTLIEHWDGTRWTVVTSPSPRIQPTLEGISAVSPNDIWAVGGRTKNNGACSSLIIHWDGTRWTQVATPDGSCLSDVHAVSANDVWAVGGGPLGYNGGTIMHFDGSAWIIVPDPVVGELNAVSAPPAT